MRQRPVSAALAVMALLAGACGTRAVVEPPSAARAPSAGTAGSVPASGAAEATGGGSAANAGDAPGAVSPVGGPNAANSPGGSWPGSGSGPATTGSGVASSGATSVAAGQHGGGTGSGWPSGSGANPTKPGSGSGAPAQPSPSPGNPAQPLPSPGPSAKAIPVLVATVGTYSGPAGATLGGYLEGVQLWTRSVNSRGGLNGHPVTLITYDDGGDPARFRAELRDAVENRHIQAFIQLSAPLTGHTAVDYLEQVKVPVVGLSGGELFGYDSPYLFPQMPVGAELYYAIAASTAQQAVPKGLTKLGMLYCAEAQACVDAYDHVAKYAPDLGLKFVYQAKTSLAQPDFTAECLAARNAGAQIVLVISDSNSLGRIAASCARQSWHPQFATGHSIPQDRHKDDPNLDGLISASAIVPYFRTGTPGTDEFHAAVAQFNKGADISVALVQGWTSGKLLERAGTHMSEPPTTAAVLSGLWSIKHDTLVDLTIPLTFGEGQKPVPQSCWYNVAIVKRQWVSVDNFVQHCR